MLTLRLTQHTDSSEHCPRSDGLREVATYQRVVIGDGQVRP
jgi:hypothetical protein